MSEIERRILTGSSAGRVSARAAAGGKPPMIAGYAAVFNSETVIGGVFRERIAPGAFRSLLAASDVVLDTAGLFNHDDNIVLGRTTNGTLRLSEDERGLRYEVDINADDPQAMGVFARVSRGDVSGSSYGFRVKDGGDTWTRAATAGDLPLRVISEIDVLRDVSPVTFPAYDETTAEVRSAAGRVATGATGAPTTAIATPVDVRHAVEALARSTQNKARVKADIIRSAYALGDAGVAELPDAWKHAQDREAHRARPATDRRAAMPQLLADDAEEAAELVAYAAMLDLVADAEAHLARVRTAVEAMVAAETTDPAIGEAEDAETQVENARLSVVQAECSQVNGAVWGVQGLAGQCLRNMADDADGSDIYVSVYRRELELIEVAV